MASPAEQQSAAPPRSAWPSITRRSGLQFLLALMLAAGIPVVATVHILDSNALVANVLSGVVELTLGRSISVEQGLDIQNRWNDGRVEVARKHLPRAGVNFAQELRPVAGQLKSPLDAADPGKETYRR